MGNILASIGLIFKLISVQFKTKTKILVFFIFANIFFALSLLTAGNYLFFSFCLILIVYFVISFFINKKGKQTSFLFSVIIIILSIILGLKFYKNKYDIILPICMTLTVFSVYCRKERNLRVLTLLVSVLFIGYDVQVKAYVVCLSDALSLVSTLAAIIRLDIFHNYLQQKQKKSILK